MTDKNKIIPFIKPDDVVNRLRYYCGFDEVLANNLSIVLSECVLKDDYSYFYKYIISEIGFRSDFNVFCNKAGLNSHKLRKTIRENNEPSLKLLFAILNGLGLKLSIKPILIKN